ncbi:NADP-dependent oxidoreductase [Nocardioides sp. AE5]|uniref:quinone oxidoreductase family protein n=1 Tax=Nocardioides sp. AE5 TaxID=2962573 RepID=UPI00288135BF|nr:NADP-dependent oxidoreductase [Nocardioides sp. AE5]MDT0202661.1 NADP-dependent oxidoreductase [Nocardioides sp. AE5]
MTHVVQFSRTGGPEVLEYVAVPTREPGPGEVLVEVRAAGLNPVEWKQRSGLRPMPGPAPWRLGSDGAGVIAAVGPDVSGWAVGERVVISNAGGVQATHVVVGQGLLDALPDGVSFATGAGLGIPAGTAYQVLTSLGLAEGETLLVHGGSGGVGQAAIQIGRALGAQVVATASSANHDRLAELGATPVAYGDGLLERVRAASPGVDVVLDCAGTDEAIEVSLAVAAPDRVGTIVRGRDAAELGVRAWLGGSPDPLTEEEVALRRAAIPFVLGLPSWSVEVAAEIPLAEVARAHAISEEGHVRGKIVLVP